MNALTQCPIEQLRAYVNDSLHEDQHSALFEHLEHCAACRQRIDDAAGPADDWALVRTALFDADPDKIGGSTAAFSGKSPSASSVDPAALLRILSPTDDPRAAGRIGPFEITGIVGTGGMGVVLKARDPALDRFVAVKILAPHLASSPTARKRFAREARAAAAVIHDNVIQIYQVAEWNELPYLVMPYLPDPSLQQRIDRHGRLDLESAVSIGLQVARGLSAAHSQGLVHRDVKPANVLLSKGTERAIITDFGLARAADDASLTRTGMLMGTPHYMSPEQARGEVVDQKSDLFSLGSLLFAMIAGRPPINHEIGSETIELIAKEDLPSLRSVAPETPSWLIRLVDWLHQPRRQDRPSSAEIAGDMLEQCLAHLRQPEEQPLPKCLTEDAKIKKKYFTTIAAAVCLAITATIIPITIWMSDPRSSASNPALSTAGQVASNGDSVAEDVIYSAETNDPTEQSEESTEWQLPQSVFSDLSREAVSIENHIESPWGIQPIKTVPGNSTPTTPKEIEQ